MTAPVIAVSSDKELFNTRKIALLMHLEEDKRIEKSYSIDMLESDQWDNSEITVNPHEIKVGLSPENAKEYVNLLIQALMLLQRDATFETFSTILKLMTEHEKMRIEYEFRNRRFKTKMINIENDEQVAFDEKQASAEQAERLLEFKQETKGKLRYHYQRMQADKNAFATLEFVELVGNHVMWGLLKQSDATATIIEEHGQKINRALNLIVSNTHKLEKEFLIAAWLGKEIEDTRPKRSNWDMRWLVLTDDEADLKAEEAADYYIDDYVWPEIPSEFHHYFDVDEFKNDLFSDSRGQLISSYDNSEEWVYLSLSNVLEFLNKHIPLNVTEDNLERFLEDPENVDEEYFLYRMD